MKNKKKQMYILLLCLTTVLGASEALGIRIMALAQEGLEPTKMALKFSMAQKKNLLALTRYTWKSRTEVQKDGETKSVKLNLVSFDASGKPQITPIGEESQEKPKRGLLRGKIQEKMEEKGKEMAKEIAKLVKDYTIPSAETMVNFFNKATFTPGPNGTVEVKGSDFLTPGDSVKMVMDSSTEQPRKLEFKTTMDGDPVEGAVSYETLPSGVYHAAQTIVTLPTKNLRAITNNFDYVRQ